MYFITNREPKGDFDKQKAGVKYDFDLDKNAPSNSVYYCQRNDKFDYLEIGSNELMKKLKLSKAKNVLLYIHGFSNLPEDDIFPRVKTLQKLFDEKEENLVLVIPIIWPCDNDKGIIKDYWDDQKSADVSSFSFARVLQKFMKWRDNFTKDEDICLKRISVLSHSMGNRVYRETLHQWNRYDLANGVPLLFRHSFLVAADIVNESLEEDKKGRLISQSSSNVSVYYSSGDLALRASKVSNLKNRIASRRLGHTGPENMSKVQTNVYAIDCEDLSNKYDFPKGHSYFLTTKKGKPGKVFEHIFNTIKKGRVESDKNRMHILK